MHVSQSETFDGSLRNTNDLKHSLHAYNLLDDSMETETASFAKHKYFDGSMGTHSFWYMKFLLPVSRLLCVCNLQGEKLVRYSQR